ncbi:competence protein ComK [Heyndrickxia sporothermodurans]
MNKVDNYVVSKQSMGIEAMDHSEFNVKIFDVRGIFYSKQTLMQLLEEACERKCTDYRGRINAVRKAFDYDRKTPLVICPIEMLYAIPTISPKDYHCKWIFPDHIETYIKKSKRDYILFRNGLQMELNCSRKSLKRQVERGRNSLVHFINYERDLFHSIRNKK